MLPKILLLSLPILFLAACHHPAKHAANGIIENDGVKISYAACGQGDTTLLFVHGWCINKGYWQPQAQYFCPRYTVVSIDLPGFGQSGKNRSNWIFEAYAKDIKAVIDQLQLKNVVLIGHSMSGDLALQAANLYPDLFIALIGIDNLRKPGKPLEPADLAGANRFFDTMHMQFKSTVNKYMRPSLFQPSTDSTIVNRVMNDVFSGDSSIATSVLYNLMITAQQEQAMMQQLSQTLYLINSDVERTEIDSLNKYCRKGCEVVEVHGTGHYPMLEKPKEFNAALEKALGRIGNGK
jgi:pimeloyl-ACP methyl ester carboxylesterase